jgi:large subunit ribosomal protein L1
MSISKRMKSITESVDRDKLYPIIDGLALLKDTAKAKFDESVDASVNLGIDSKKIRSVSQGCTSTA